MSEKQSKTAEKQQRKPKNKEESAYIEALRDFIKGRPLTPEAGTALAGLDRFLLSDEYKAFKDKVQAVSDYIAAHREEFTAASRAEQAITDFAPFLQMELESSEEYAQLVYEEILAYFISKRPITNKQIIRAIDRAKKRQAEYEKDRQAIEEIELAAEPFINVFNNLPINDLITTRQSAYKRTEIQGEAALEARKGNTKIILRPFLNNDEKDEVIESKLNALQKKASAPTWAVFLASLAILCQKMPADKAKELFSADKALEMGSIYMSFKDYAKLRNITEDRARKQINDAGAFLYRQDITNDYMTFTKNGKKEREPFHARLLSYWEPGIGAAKFVFSQEIVRYFIDHPQIVLITPQMFQIDLKNYEHAFYMFYKMCLHHGMNVQKSNSNLLSVASLLEAIPSLQSYESAGKRVGQLIRDPFERNLNYLKDNGFLVDWNYCGKDMAELPDSKHSTLKYADWINLNIDFEIANYPEDKQQKRLAKKAEQIEERKRKQAVKEEIALERKEAREKKKTAKK